MKTPNIFPRTRRIFEDPEEFYQGLKSKKIIIDKIHRLNNLSEVLKIGVDYFPQIKIIVTGSSNLGSSKKFKDTLTGRKRNIWLLPMTIDDLKDFNNHNLIYRLHRGGLPPFFLSKTYPQIEFQEWMDDYWNKDIVELFHLEKRYSFQKFIELVFIQSGSIDEFEPRSLFSFHRHYPKGDNYVICKTSIYFKLIFGFISFKKTLISSMSFVNI